MFARLRRWLESRPPIIDSIKTLDVKPGQIVVVTTPQHLTTAQVGAMRASLSKWSEGQGVKVFFIARGMDVSVMQDPALSKSSH